jgi:type I restriction-modification system DNA methylase subunit
MFNDDISKLIEDKGIADVVIDVCATLYHNGIDYVHVGGLMRLLGVSQEEAEQHDEVYFQLDQDFAQKLADLDAIDEAYEEEIAKENETPPTIH